MDTLNINLPDLGIDEVEVIEILVKEKDSIKKDQVLLVVESNKTTIEIPSDKNGIINKIFVKLGDKVKLNDPIFEIFNNKEDFNIKKNKNFTIIFPNLKLNFKVYVHKIFLNLNDKFFINDPLIVIKKENFEKIIYSTCDGIIKNIFININDELKINKNLFLIEYNDNILKENFINYTNNIILPYIKDEEKNTLKINNEISSSPSIRRIAREFNIDISLIKSKNKNRISKEDIYEYIITNKNLNNKNNNFLTNKNYLSDLSYPDLDFKKFGDIEYSEIKGINKISGKRLYFNWINIPHVTQFSNIDITDLENFRKKYNKELKENNKETKISLLSFIMKSISYALKEFNIFNSSMSDDYTKLVIKKYINIGFAVDTKYGLVVPNIKNVYNKNILEISNELQSLSIKAKNKKLDKNDIEGGNFTISSLGSIGDCEFFTPIINFPEVSILGISKFSIKPKWIDDKFYPRLILPVSLSYDHRVINGADAVRFMNFITKLLEDCRRLLI